MQKINYKFSIIIPHLNEGYYLDIMLDSFYNYIKYDNYEIIIMDDGSDNLSELDFLQNHKLNNKIKVFFRKNMGLANIKNIGAKKSKGDILIFLDSHMYIKDNILLKIKKLFNKNKNIDLLQPIIGSIEDKRMEGGIYKIKDNLFYSDWDLPIKKGKNLKFNNIKDVIETPNIAGGATIVKRKVFNSLSGFNKNFIKWGCEDLDFSMRAWLMGYRCFFSPKLFIAHYFKQSFKNTTVKTEEVLNNRLMFLYTCFRDKSIVSLALNDISNHYGKELFEKINDNVINNKTFLKWLKNQKEIFKYNDRWYLDKFKDYYPFFKRKKIAIITQYTDDIYNYSKYTFSINKEYAKKNGYDFIVYKGRTIDNQDKHIYWDKIDIIKKFLNNYEYIVWIDADIMIMNHDIKIEKFITDKDLMICSDNSNSGEKNTLNTGSYILKNSKYSKILLDKLYELGKENNLINNFPAEQGALVLMYQKNILKLKNNITVYSETTFNSANPAHLLYKEGQFVLHMMMTDSKVREDYFKKYFNKINSKYNYNLEL